MVMFSVNVPVETSIDISVGGSRDCIANRQERIGAKDQIAGRREVAACSGIPSNSITGVQARCSLICDDTEVARVPNIPRHRCGCDPRLEWLDKWRVGSADPSVH